MSNIIKIKRGTLATIPALADGELGGCTDAPGKVYWGYGGTNRLIGDGVFLPLTGGTLTAALTLHADPTSNLHAATKQYVDGLVQGIDAKASVKAATTANITLSGTQTIDGIALSVGDRVLVKDQSTTSENGVYVVAAGAWARSSDADSWAELPALYTWVEQGTANGDSGWLCTVDAGGTLGSTAVTFTQFSGAGSITAGDGLTKTGSTINVVGTSNRITVSADAVDIASTYAGQSTITILGTVTTGTWNANVIPANYGGTGVANAAGSTITLGGALTLAGAYTTTLTVTGNTSVTLPTSGTLAVTSNKLSAFASTTSAELAGVISDETGSGSLVFATSPALVTPALGAATATSINKVTITAPASSATLTIANGGSLITSGAYSITLTATGATNVTLPTSGTLISTTTFTGVAGDTFQLNNDANGGLLKDYGDGLFAVRDHTDGSYGSIAVATVRVVNGAYEHTITAPASTGAAQVMPSSAGTLLNSASTSCGLTGTTSSSFALATGSNGNRIQHNATYGIVARTYNDSAYVPLTSSQLFLMNASNQAQVYFAGSTNRSFAFPDNAGTYVLSDASTIDGGTW